MDHSETSRQRARRFSAVAAGASCALLFLGCNVYDSSLLESSLSSSSGGSGNSGNGVAGVSDMPGAAGTAVSSSGGAGSGGSVGAIGTAGDDSSDNGGSGGKPTSMGGSGGTDSTIGNGSTGGTSPTAGSGGMTTIGGSAAGGAVSSEYSMIDDMENPDPYILAMDGRVGYWSLANDGTKGTQTPIPMTMSQILPSPRGSSTYALHTTAMGYTLNGAQVDVDLNRKAAVRATYDASPYVAIHFWAKAAATNPALHVAMPDIHTDPSGATCAVKPQQCYDHFAADRTLTTDWAEYTVAFSDLNQLGWGMNGNITFDAAQMYAINFSWDTRAMDLWVDDLAFVKK